MRALFGLGMGGESGGGRLACYGSSAAPMARNSKRGTSKRLLDGLPDGCSRGALSIARTGMASDVLGRSATRSARALYPN